MKAIEKRGEAGNFLMFFSFLFVLLIIAGGVVAEVYLFFGNEYDFRSVDAQILRYKISDCLSQGKADILNLDESFYEKCRIDKKVLSDNKIVFKICKSGEDCAIEKNPVFSEGGNFESCRFEGAKNNENFLKCFEENVEINEEEYIILTGSNQRIKYRSLE